MVNNSTRQLGYMVLYTYECLGKDWSCENNCTVLNRRRIIIAADSNLCNAIYTYIFVCLDVCTLYYTYLFIL